LALRLHPALRAKAQFQKFRAQWASWFIEVVRSFTIAPNTAVKRTPYGAAYLGR
jgi:hypothetical protein